MKETVLSYGACYSYGTAVNCPQYNMCFASFAGSEPVKRPGLAQGPRIPLPPTVPVRTRDEQCCYPDPGGGRVDRERVAGPFLQGAEDGRGGGTRRRGLSEEGALYTTLGARLSNSILAYRLTCM